MSVTVPVPITRHLMSYLVAAVATIALAVAVVAAFAVANDDASPSPRSHSSVTSELPCRFCEGRGASADATGR